VDWRADGRRLALAPCFRTSAGHSSGWPLLARAAGRLCFSGIDSIAGGCCPSRIARSSAATGDPHSCRRECGAAPFRWCRTGRLFRSSAAKDAEVRGGKKTGLRPTLIYAKARTLGGPRHRRPLRLHSLCIARLGEGATKVALVGGPDALDEDCRSRRFVVTRYGRAAAGRDGRDVIEQGGRWQAEGGIGALYREGHGDHRPGGRKRHFRIEIGPIRQSEGIRSIAPPLPGHHCRPTGQRHTRGCLASGAATLVIRPQASFQKHAHPRLANAHGGDPGFNALDCHKLGPGVRCLFASKPVDDHGVRADQVVS